VFNWINILGSKNRLLNIYSGNTILRVNMEIIKNILGQPVVAFFGFCVCWLSIFFIALFKEER